MKHLEHVNFKLFLSQSDISSLNNVQLCLCVHNYMNSPSCIYLKYRYSKKGLLRNTIQNSM